MPLRVVECTVYLNNPVHSRYIDTYAADFRLALRDQTRFNEHTQYPYTDFGHTAL